MLAAALPVFVEADGLAEIGKQHDVVGAAGFGYAHQTVAFFHGDGFDALAAHVFKGGKLDFFHHALRGGEEDVLVFGEIAHGKNGADFFVFFELDNVVNRAPAAVAAAFGQLVHLNPMAAAEAGEAHQVIVGVGDKQAFDKVFVFGGGGLFAAPAAPLGLVVGGRLGFDVAAVGERNHHFARRNQVLVGNVAAEGVDFAAAFVAEIVFGFFQLFADDLGDAFGFGENVDKVDDLRHDGFVVGNDGVLVETGQVAQAHAQDGVGLQFAQMVAVAAQAEIFRQPFGARHLHVQIGAREHFAHQAGLPRPRQ